jgi:hypothetical protein
MNIIKYLQHIFVVDSFELNDKHYDKVLMHCQVIMKDLFWFEPLATQSNHFFHDVIFSIEIEISTKFGRKWKNELVQMISCDKTAYRRRELSRLEFFIMDHVDWSRNE